MGTRYPLMTELACFGLGQRCVTFFSLIMRCVDQRTCAMEMACSSNAVLYIYTLIMHRLCTARARSPYIGLVEITQSATTLFLSAAYTTANPLQPDALPIPSPDMILNIPSLCSTICYHMPTHFFIISITPLVLTRHPLHTRNVTVSLEGAGMIRDCRSRMKRISFVYAKVRSQSDYENDVIG